MLLVTSVPLLLAFAVPTVNGAGLYGKDSTVIQLDSKSWDKLVYNGQHPSVRESESIIAYLTSSQMVEYFHHDHLGHDPF